MRWLAVLAALLAPVPALACAVCAQAVERNRTAFLGTTLLLSFLPLTMIAGGLWWVARQSRHTLASDFAERDEIPDAARPAPAAAADSAAAP